MRCCGEGSCWCLCVVVIVLVDGYGGELDSICGVFGCFGLELGRWLVFCLVCVGFSKLGFG